MSAPGAQLAVDLEGTTWSAKVHLPRRKKERKETSFPGATGARQYLCLEQANCVYLMIPHSDRAVQDITSKTLGLFSFLSTSIEQ